MIRGENKVLVCTGNPICRLVVQYEQNENEIRVLKSSAKFLYVHISI